MAYAGPLPQVVNAGGTGAVTLTNHGVVIGQGTSAVHITAAGSAGQVLQSGGGAADPTYSTPTYPSASGSAGKILISDGTNNIYSTPTYPNTSATAGKILVSDGTNNIYSTPTFPNASATSRKIIVSDGTNWVASTETYAVPGTSGNIMTSNGTNWTSATPVVPSATITQFDVLVGGAANAIVSVGPGSAGQVLQSGGNASNPVYSTATYPATATGTGTILRADGTNWVATTATYPATTTINRVLFSSANNTVSEITAVNQAVMTSSTTGVPSFTSLATNGQVIIGSTAGNPAAATLTAGTGISISNGSNSITINATGASGGGLVWADVTGSTQTVVAGSGYLADRALGVTFTLPASSTIGDVFRIAGVQGSWTLAQSANQQIKFGNKSTTVGATGSLASTNAQDCVELVASNTSASSVWIVISSIGNITVA